ncbi:MAG: tyrosine-type recombinase/integrase [Candidatus Humimicrobiaceae bacterium]
MNDQAFFNRLILETVFNQPIRTCISKFVYVLLRQGYVRYTVFKKIKVISKLSQWLQKKRLSIKDLDEVLIKKFICYLKKRNCLQLGNWATLKQFINFLQEENILPAPVTKPGDSEIEIIENSFSKYLKQERGLSQATMDKYLPTIRLFLMERFGKKNIILDKLRPTDISGFILRYAHTMSISGTQSMITALRSFFSFLYQRGQIPTNLAAAVPFVSRWRYAPVPKYLQPEQVKRILEACDQETAIGQRNYAILLLLARLGLRAGEIVNMELEDINWESGEIMVRGKSSREQKLPLPDEVGKAIAAYIRYCRPRCCSLRKVFICMKAPRHGFLSSASVCTIVRQSLKDAGIEMDFKGAHLFRHTLAINMLSGGATIKEIGQILGHQLPAATEIYAKVDLGALRSIAQPWPGGKV